MQLLPEGHTRARLALCWPWTSPLQEEKGCVGFSSGYHSPTLTYERAVKSKKSLCDPLRSTEEKEKGSLQTLESPAVSAETGEVHVPGSTIGRACKCCANAASFSRVPLEGLASSDLLDLLFTPTHSSHHTCVLILPLCH